MLKVNIAEKFAQINEPWKPRIAAELNGQMVKFGKFKGEFVFHHHEKEDELFLVIKGRFRMEFRDRHEWIEEGEVDRCAARRRASPSRRRRKLRVLLFEPASTLNTGNVVNERTLPELERI